eukprot:scaffold88643_cov27-Tisochrysis_lutea.AAC.4
MPRARARSPLSLNPLPPSPSVLPASHEPALYLPTSLPQITLPSPPTILSSHNWPFPFSLLLLMSSLGFPLASLCPLCHPVPSLADQHRPVARRIQGWCGRGRWCGEAGGHDRTPERMRLLLAW